MTGAVFMHSCWSLPTLALALLLPGTVAMAQQADPAPTPEVFEVERDRSLPFLDEAASRGGAETWREIFLQRTGLTPQVLSTVRMPVLLPAETIAVAETVFESNPAGTAYTATIKILDAQIEILGTRQGFKLPAEAPRVASRAINLLDPNQFLVETMESGINLSFQAYGVGYQITVLCDDLKDFRCEDETFVRQVALQMLELGGAQ